MIDFAIIGGGPVGLLCAVALRRLGRSVEVIERDRHRRSHSRSIGIHAASLARLDELGLLDSFVARGVRIERGVAVGSRGRLGDIDFGQASTRHGFALSLPQPQTEALLEDAARRLGARVLRGANFVAVKQRRDHVSITYRCHDERRRVKARHLLGCDGGDSSVRAALGIHSRTWAYPGSYLMAEFPETPQLGRDAWIFLADDGLVESFPLPGRWRRWVVEAPGRRDHVAPDEMCRLIRERCGVELEPRAIVDAGAFGVEQRLARRFCRGRALLLGDAAHVVSPFGGQGMNLGWLDAMALADVVARRWDHAGLRDDVLASWAHERRRAARVALRQAAINTWIGRWSAAPRLRNALVRVVLRVSAPALSRRFAMQSLV